MMILTVEEGIRLGFFRLESCPILAQSRRTVASLEPFRRLESPVLDSA